MADTHAPAPAPADTPAPAPTEAPITNEADARAFFEEEATRVAAEMDGAAPPPAPTPPPETDSPAPPAAPAATPAPEALSLNAEDLAAIRALPTQIKTLGGRVAKLQGEMTKLGTAAAASTEAGGGAAPDKRAIDAAAGDLTKWNKLKEEFPEWSDALEQRLSSLGGGVDVESIRKQVREEALSEFTAREAAKRDAAIEEAHENWRDTMNSPEFKEWFGKQPADKQSKWWNSHSEHTIIKMLDTYESAQQQSGASAPAPVPAPAPAQARTPAPAARSTAPAVDLRAAVTRRGSTSLPPKSEEEMTEKELWDHLAGQETARRNAERR
jgi:hypothetical protein